MPFQPRHEISYQRPAQGCGWVSGAGHKKLPPTSVKREELGDVRQAGPRGAWDEFVSQVLRTRNLACSGRPAGAYSEVCRLAVLSGSLGQCLTSTAALACCSCAA